MPTIKAAGGVRVHGLAELNRALRELDRGLQSELKQAHLDAATMVADDARGLAYSQGSTAAKAAPSIRPFGGTTSAGVRLGGVGYELGAEFGGQRRPTTQQFKPWRGSGPGAGYFLYPAIRQDMPRVEEQYERAVEAVIRRAGL